MRVENEALQKLVLQLAPNKGEAQSKLASIRERFGAGDALASGGSVSPSNQHGGKGGQPKPPAPLRPPSLTAKEIQRLASAAAGAGERVFVLPEGVVPAGSQVRLYYNRAGGPLAGSDGELALKVGLNDWETQHVEPLRPVRSLTDGEWWCGDVALPELLVTAEYAVFDTVSNRHDNNGGRNFQLALSGTVSPQGLQIRRLELYEAAEAAREAERLAEEARLQARSRAAAEKASAAVREAFRKRKQRQLQQEAAVAVAARRRGVLDSVVAAAAKPGVYQWLDEEGAGEPRAGRTATLAYNKASGALHACSSVNAVVGFDAWHGEEKVTVPMRPLGAEAAAAHGLSGAWVAATVPIDPIAQVVDFVFTDDDKRVWDNNALSDYHSLIAGALSDAALAERLVETARQEEAAEIAKQEDLAAKRALEKAEIKYEAERQKRAQLAPFLYTRPCTPRAGEAVELFYNPDLTTLRGRPKVFVRGGFNRWTQNNFAPQAMTSVGIGGFKSARIQVPRNAHLLDFVFLDSDDTHGGFIDDNHGLDYHLPVVGGAGRLEPLRVVHVAAEMAPIAKEGGLGDVVTALGRAVQEEGHDVEVVLPKYDCINYDLVEDLKLIKEFWHNGVEIKVWRGIVEDLKTTFLEPCNGMFWVGRIYTEMHADRHRFGVWCEAACEYLRHHADQRIPDIIHAHDWQSAPCTWMDCGTARSAFTIHNLNYGADLIERAMHCAAVATTVSPTYALEVSGHPAVAPNHAKFHGIRNGIDQEIWDPAEDEFLPLGYSADTFMEGKAAAKSQLRAKMNLSDADVPLVGVVTRLTHQKGVHLIKHAAWRVLERGGQFVLLGSAPDPRVQAEFNALAADLARTYPDRARLWFAYNEPLSHLIYAGADMLLVPSMFEPCGLTQMIAMRYGTVPIVRRTGGLNDTVFDVDHDEERAAAEGMAVNGFSFEGTDAPGIDYALNRALDAWQNERAWFYELAQRDMRIDWSWTKPALDYIELYYKALRRG
ncbi:hypothetical protein QBZ16_005127 [Prototheca wickerhamii]|uniref:starch synthase n=1 Tax=Prototheca wickerhamii TaxID=3111 RepID=A0AAD9IGW1_PROWI|nr:hypothetical protein QBZ16_005127 [Prototheca wickerhamii]